MPPTGEGVDVDDGVPARLILHDHVEAEQLKSQALTHVGRKLVQLGDVRPQQRPAYLRRVQLADRRTRQCTQYIRHSQTS